MGEIVAAVGTCHTPYMFTRPPDENPQQLDQAGAGDAGARQGARRDQAGRHPVLRRRSRRDVFGHLRARRSRSSPAAAPSRKFAGREHNLPIHREMAEDILNKLVVDHSFDIAYSEDAELGHAFSVPFEYVIGERNIPVIPFFTNVYVPPLPTPQAVRGAGQGDRRDRQGPQGTRRDHRERRHVAFPRHDQVSASGVRFRSLAASRSSRPATPTRCSNMTGTQLDEVGNTEMLSWAMMFGAIGAQEGELIDYIPTWHHGLGMMRFLPQRARKNDADRGRGAVRRLRVQEPGLPVLQASAGGGVRPQQAPVRVAAQRGAARAHHRRLSTRSRDEYELHGEQRAAAEELINVGKGGLVSEHVGPLAEAGAHPLQALMSLHVIFSTSHARGQQAMAAETLNIGSNRSKRSTRSARSIGSAAFTRSTDDSRCHENR